MGLHPHHRPPAARHHRANRTACSLSAVTAAFCTLLVLAVGPLGAAAHGYLLDPPARNWVAYNTPSEQFYDPQSGNGLGNAKDKLTAFNNGWPNVAGDPFQGLSDTTKFLNRPFRSQKTFAAGATIPLAVHLTTNHGGRFTFRICPRTTNIDEACFGNNYLTRADNGAKEFYLKERAETYFINYKLPANIVCPGGCVMQWKYEGFQSCSITGQCDPAICGDYAAGVNMITNSRNMELCTPDKIETFNNLADITITGDGSVTPPPPPPQLPSPSPSPVPPPSPSPNPPPPNTDCNGCSDAACYCKTVPAGNYANPFDANCYSFIQCANGASTITNCPSGTIYDANAKVCNWPSPTNPCKPACASPAPSPSPSPNPPGPNPSPSPSPSPPIPPISGSSCLKNVVYWGQNSVSRRYPDRANWEKALDYYCTTASDDYDIINLSFLHVFKDAASGMGPAGEPLPNINLAYHCETTFKSLGDPSFPNSNLLKCPNVAASIKTCQARGKKILLSLGGASGSYGFASDAEATQFAKIVWQMFLGGSAPGWPRPFGDAVLDGIDLDIEGGGPAGYATLVRELRALYTSPAANPASRQYLITGAPQCPFPDAHMSDVLAKSWFDYVWVQFYNNYCAASGNSFNFVDWSDWATKTSVNKDVKIVMGIPAATYSGNGWLSTAQARARIDELTTLYPSVFGGVMLWDAGVADAEKNADGTSYGAEIQAYLRTKSATGCSVSPPTPPPEPRPSPLPSPSPSPVPPPSPSPNPPPPNTDCNGCSDAACYCKTVPTGNYANPFDAKCYSFIQCANGAATITNCPSGTIYDTNAKVCNWPSPTNPCKPACPMPVDPCAGKANLTPCTSAAVPSGVCSNNICVVNKCSTAKCPAASSPCKVAGTCIDPLTGACGPETNQPLDAGCTTAAGAPGICTEGTCVAIFNPCAGKANLTPCTTPTILWGVCSNNICVINQCNTTACPAPSGTCKIAGSCNNALTGTCSPEVNKPNGAVCTTATNVAGTCSSGTCIAKTPASCTTAITTPVANGVWPTGGCANTVSGGTCRATCSTGYTGAPTATCTNGAWGAVSGACTKTTTTCTTAITTPVANGLWPTGGCANTVSGGSCRAACSTGFTGSPTATCTNGVWGAVTGACTPASCTTAITTPVANGLWPTGGCANTVSGGSCRAACSTGFTGSPTATCTNGVWGAVTGACTPANEIVGGVPKDKFVAIFVNKVDECTDLQCGNSGAETLATVERHWGYFKQAITAAKYTFTTAEAAMFFGHIRHEYGGSLDNMVEQCGRKDPSGNGCLAQRTPRAYHNDPTPGTWSYTSSRANTFYGRGPNQLSHLFNYRALQGHIQAALGTTVDLVNQPQLLFTKGDARSMVNTWLGAIFYWTKPEFLCSGTYSVGTVIFDPTKGGPPLCSVAANQNNIKVVTFRHNYLVECINKSNVNTRVTRAMIDATPPDHGTRSQIRRVDRVNEVRRVFGLPAVTDENLMYC